MEQIPQSNVRNVGRYCYYVHSVDAHLDCPLPAGYLLDLSSHGLCHQRCSALQLNEALWLSLEIIGLALPIWHVCVTSGVELSDWHVCVTSGVLLALLVWHICVSRGVTLPVWHICVTNGVFILPSWYICVPLEGTD